MTLSTLWTYTKLTLCLLGLWVTAMAVVVAL